MKKELEKIIEPLLKWYQENKRQLPWREEKNAYHIWLSEIMLQQTRIEAVKKYYDRFIKEVPTIHDLANIEEEKLLKLWEGLGYYNRARNLKKAAQMIQKDYQGKMPTSYQKLITLPGIGEYTAGAISSIAYDEKMPAVDGNVLRVVSRILANKKDVLLPETKKEVTVLLKEIMPKQAGDFNEALMELGELVCLPNGKPLCEKCPLKEYCKANKKELTDQIPVRKIKTKRKQEEKTVFILITKTKEIAIQKRKEKGLLSGMYEFPNIGKKMKIQEIEELLAEWKLEVKAVQKIGTYKHVFTHIDWYMEGYQVEVTKKDEDYIWVSKQELEEDYAMPTAFQVFLKKIV